jgi:hypothetical protein
MEVSRENKLEMPPVHISSEIMPLHMITATVFQKRRDL